MAASHLWAFFVAHLERTSCDGFFGGCGRGCCSCSCSKSGGKSETYRSHNFCSAVCRLSLRSLCVLVSQRFPLRFSVCSVLASVSVPVPLYMLGAVSRLSRVCFSVFPVTAAARVFLGACPVVLCVVLYCADAVVKMAISIFSHTLIVT